MIGAEGSLTEGCPPARRLETLDLPRGHSSTRVPPCQRIVDSPFRAVLRSGPRESFKKSGQVHRDDEGGIPRAAGQRPDALGQRSAQAPDPVRSTGDAQVPRPRGRRVHDRCGARGRLHRTARSPEDRAGARDPLRLSRERDPHDRALPGGLVAPGERAARPRSPCPPARGSSSSRCPTRTARACASSCSPTVASSPRVRRFLRHWPQAERERTIREDDRRARRGSRGLPRAGRPERARGRPLHDGAAGGCGVRASKARASSGSSRSATS